MKTLIKSLYISRKPREEEEEVDPPKDPETQRH